MNFPHFFQNFPPFFKIFISEGKVKRKHVLSQILVVNQHLKMKQYMEGANMAEIAKQNKIQKNIKLP